MMLGSTCKRCWDGRHIRCEAKGTCQCSICGVPAEKPFIQRVTKPRVRKDSGGNRHGSIAAQKVNHLKGRHALAGYSSLPEATQAEIARRLDDGESLSAIARAVGCTRDQVRTIRNRAEGVTHKERRAVA